LSPFRRDDFFQGGGVRPDGIYIRGAGRNSTYLIKSDNTGNFMIMVDTKTGKPFKFTNITLQVRLDALQGSNRTVFVEDNLFDLNRHCATATNGANYVARYNTVKDNYQDSVSFDAHGLSRAWPRGTRSVEIYGNVVTNSIRRFGGAGIRGGSGVIWGNSWNGVSAWCGALT
jgi:hypothetical protein